jgi:Zn-dependent peptidase ImmA (M78 family)
MQSLRQLFKRLQSADADQRDALRQFNLMPGLNGKAVSVKSLAEKLGLSVYEVDLPNGMAGRLVQDAFSDSGFAIEVNKTQNVRSKRFTVLHELGHFFMHANKDDVLADPLLLSRSDDQFYYDTKQEREANDFADVLLFGDGALEAAVSLLNRDVKRLSNFFGVTEKMIEVALRKFRL